MPSPTLPPYSAWPSVPPEFVRWFNDLWRSVIANINGIEGVTTNVGTLSGGLDLTNTNLTTLQAAVTTLQGRATTDESAITALQTRATTDEAAMLTKADNLASVVSASAARTNLGLGSGLSVTVTTAKLTTSGTNGSLTFTNGVLTAKVDPT